MKKLLFKLGMAFGLAAMFMMAEVEKTPDAANAAGKEPTVLSGLSAADTYLIPNKNGNVQLRVINANEADTTVTIVTPGELGANPVSDRAVEVKKTKIKVIGPFDPAVYNNSKGFLEVKFSSVLGVTLELQQVGF